MSAAVELTEWTSIAKPHGGVRRKVPWRDLASSFAQEPRRVPPSACEWEAAKGKYKKPQSTKAYALATFRNNYRNGQVEAVHAVTVDVDGGVPPFAEAVAFLRPFAGVVYTTFNHRRPAPDGSTGPDCYRAQIATTRAMTPEEYHVVWDWFRAKLDAAGFQHDPTAREPSRGYFWGSALDGAPYESVELDGEPLDVDAILADAPPSAVAPSTTSTKADPSPREDEPEWLARITQSTRMKRASKWAELAETAVSGDRGHNVKMRTATAVVRGFALSRANALAVMREWSVRCSPPWSERELAHAVDEAQGIGAMEWGEKLRERDEHAGTADAPPSRAPVAWATRLVTVEPDWLRVKPPPREYLMRDLRTGNGAIPARGVGVLGAAGGAGKSFATIQAALATATGAPWLGAFRPERAGRVLLVSAEDPTDEVRRRLFDIASAHGVATIPPGTIDVVDVHDMHAPLLDTDGRPTDHARGLIDFAGERGPYSLVIVDPAARLAGANIDADNAIATALVSTLEAVSTAAQGLVLVAHHTSQAARRAGLTDATALRGATGFGDGARLVMLLTVQEVNHDDDAIAARLGELVTITRSKANHVPRWDPVQLRRGEHGVLVPLDSYDLELVAEARARANPRAERQAQRAEARRAMDVAADEALRSVLERSPGIGKRELRAEMAAYLGGCSAPRTEDALARASASVRRETKGKSVRHYWAGA